MTRSRIPFCLIALRALRGTGADSDAAGQPRHDLADVGCDEWSTEPVGRRHPRQPLFLVGAAKTS